MQLTTNVCAPVALGLMLAASCAVNAQPAPKATGSRGVAALGRIEPVGGVVHVAAASTPDAMSGAVLVKLLVDRGSDVAAGHADAD